MINIKLPLKDWTCSECGNTNPLANSFCEYCGHARQIISTDMLQKKMADATKMISNKIGAATAKRTCPQCGNACKMTEAFCSSCGAKLKDSDFTPMQEIAPQKEAVVPTITCIHCGNQSSDQARFCRHCGKEIRIEEDNAKENSAQVDQIFCPECGTVQQAGIGFCNECGAKIEVEDSHTYSR